MTLTLGLLQTWAVSLMIAVFLFACVVMMLTVLIQRPQGGGLSGAFGSGGGAGQTAFGTKTGDALTIATIIMFIVFLGLAIGLNFATRPENIAGARQVAQSTDNGQPADTTEETTDGTTTVDEPAGQPADAGDAPPDAPDDTAAAPVPDATPPAGDEPTPDAAPTGSEPATPEDAGADAPGAG